MKLYLLALYLLLILALSAGSALACTCGKLKADTMMLQTSPAPSAEEVAKWRQEQTDYALFTGQVIKIEKIKVKRSQGSNDKSVMKKVTVKVESYWLGVTDTNMVIYTGVGNGDCGVPYQRGRSYLFWASRHLVSRLLETNICGPTTLNDKAVSGFDEIFGKAKSFL
jgi:hypothetical protein